MKNIYRYIILLAALLSCSTALMAQKKMEPGTGPKGVVFNKAVSDGAVPNSYELTIDAFVTGETQTTEEIVPCDIMLVLDVSTSMSASQGNQYLLSSFQQLTTGNNIGILHTTTGGTNNYQAKRTLDKVNTLRYRIKIDDNTYNLIYHNGAWYYGTLTSWSDSPPNSWTEYKRNNPADIIYTDVKIDLLQKAVNDFIATVRTNAETNNVEHKIGVATYCGSLKQYCDITDVKNGEFTVHTGGTTTRNVDMTDFVNDLHNHMGGDTKHYLGFQQAETLYKNLYGGNTLEAALKSKNAEGRSQVVVFFTDGDPNSDQYNIISQTIVDSYNFKKNNVKVYSIGVFSDKNIDDTDLTLSQFLDIVSSDYPNAESYSKRGSHIAKESGKDHKFYFKAEGADLSSIFTTIAEESSKADYTLTATSTSVIDIISESFVIPEDTPDGEYDGTKYKTNEKGNAIGLYVAPVTGYFNDEYTFGTEVLAKAAKDGDESICPDIKATVAGDKLTVTGFDYSKYCVREVDGKYKGYKLVIKIKIEINPANPGGADVPTNKIGSGIYYEGKQIAEFQQPDVKIPNIIIIKKGLKKGESATFTVEGKDMSPMILVATCKADGADAIAKAKIQKPGRYTVTENTWSWAYDLSTLVKEYAQEDDANKTVVDEDARSITRNVNVYTENSDYHGTLFIFENAAKENMPDHGESYKLNVFYEQNTNK